MISPTSRANEVWEVNGGDDLLQLMNRTQGNLGGIDSTGAGYGSLAGGGIPAGVSGDIQINNGGAFGSADEVFSGAEFRLSPINGDLTVIVGASMSFSSAGSLSALNFDSGTGGSNFNTTGAITMESTADVNFVSDTGAINLTASAGGMRITAASFLFFTGTEYNFDLGGLPVFANNAAAITGGLGSGDLYRTGGDPDPVCVVH